MSSASSTDRRPPVSGQGLQPWQFYLLLALVAATVAVALTRHTSPTALALLSAAILAAGLAAAAVHYALTGFFGLRGDAASLAPLDGRTRDLLEREKMLALRSIKELEFDRAMGKVSDADFAEMNANLRARAAALLRDLDRASDGPAPPAMAPPARTETGACPSCGTANDLDARFCKSCGARMTA